MTPKTNLPIVSFFLIIFVSLNRTSAFDSFEGQPLMKDLLAKIIHLNTFFL
ncbi:MAG: hypothetical protein ACW98F_00970 [Candidatus Hodarchaeales archaeon]